MRKMIWILAAMSVWALSGETKPAREKGIAQEERPADWLRATERLRWLPRPGEIHNAGVLANVGDIVETTPEQKAAIVEALKAYDSAILKKAEQWETELKALRAEQQAKVIAALPEARREAARKALEYSQAQWTLPLDFEARLRAAMMEKLDATKSPKTPAEEADTLRREMRDWIKAQRLKESEHNAETIKTLKEMLDPAEAERLKLFDKNREVPPQTPPKK